MTFNKAAWAIDGALLNSSLARTEVYSANSGAEGIVQSNDLVVSALDTAGNGVKISAGSALVLNRYRGYLTTDEAYVVSNSSPHVATGLVSSSASAQAFLVAVVIGDPEFAQTGHPWMSSSDPAPGTEATFAYVRPTLIPCGPSDTALPDAYPAPAVVLARVNLPANTTTITNAMITDLRKLARPRVQLNVGFSAAPSSLNSLNTTSGWERFPNVAGIQSITIPRWAVKAKVMGFVEGARLDKAGVCRLQPYIEGTSLVGSVTNIDEYAPRNQKDRRTYNVGGEFDVTSIRGQTVNISVRGQANAGNTGVLFSDGNTSVMLQVFFEEAPVG